MGGGTGIVEDAAVSVGIVEDGIVGGGTAGGGTVGGGTGIVEFAEGIHGLRANKMGRLAGMPGGIMAGMPGGLIMGGWALEASGLLGCPNVM